MKIVYATFIALCLAGCSATSKDGSGVSVNGAICANGYCIVPAPQPVILETPQIEK